VVRLNKIPQRAYKNYGLESKGWPKHIKTYCFWMRDPAAGLEKLWFGEQGMAKAYPNLLFLDKTPQRAYKKYGLESNGRLKHIKIYCFWMRPRSGLIKTMVWE
jgi:hypothetical protein